MAGDQPGPAPQVTAGTGAGGTALADPVTDLAGFALPAGSPGGQMLQGPRAAAFTPQAPARVRPVVQLPPPPGQPGRMVTLPDGRKGMTPSGLAALPHLAVPAVPQPKIDPPIGSAVIQGQWDGSIVVNPLPLAYAGDDAAVINTACLQAQQQGADTLTGQNPGGCVVLGYGNFVIKSGIVKPASVSIRGQGNGTRLITAAGFTGTVLYTHRTVGYNPQFGAPAQQGTGYVRDLVIDGTGSGPGSIGLDIGDGFGYDVRAVQVINFAATTTFTATAAGVLTLPAGVSLPNGFPVQLQGTALPAGANAGFLYYVTASSGNTCSLLNAFGGAPVTFGGTGAGTLQCSIGFHLTDYVFWSEKSYGYNLVLTNNAIAAVLDTTNPGGGGGDVSLEYNNIEINMFCNAGQTGVVVGGGANLGGVRLWIYGNMSSLPVALTSPQAGCAMLTFSGQDSGNDSPSRLYLGELHTKVESNPGNGGGLAQAYAILFATGAEAVEICGGHLCHSLANSVLNGGEFSFYGAIGLSDTGLSQVFPSNFVSGTVNAPGTQAGQPTVPPSGKNFINYAPAMTVYITAGTGGLTVTKAGASVTFAAGVTLPFVMNPREQLSLTYTNAPAWVWMPATRAVGP